MDGMNDIHDIRYASSEYATYRFNRLTNLMNTDGDERIALIYDADIDRYDDGTKEYGMTIWNTRYHAVNITCSDFNMVRTRDELETVELMYINKHTGFDIQHVEIKKENVKDKLGYRVGKNAFYYDEKENLYVYCIVVTISLGERDVMQVFIPYNKENSMGVNMLVK